MNIHDRGDPKVRRKSLKNGNVGLNGFSICCGPQIAAFSHLNCDAPPRGNPLAILSYQKNAEFMSGRIR
jgi:hypothetical protein